MSNHDADWDWTSEDYRFAMRALVVAVLAQPLIVLAMMGGFWLASQVLG